MSYSIESPCSACNKNGMCSDDEIISGAINDLHRIGVGLFAHENPEKDHLGVGIIKIDCRNLEKKEV